MTSINHILSVNNVSYKYPGASESAVDSVSFSVSKGEYLTILGPNGSGKSTLMRIISGFLACDSGDVFSSTDIVGTVFQSPRSQIIAGIVSDDTEFGPENLRLSPSEIELRVVESLSVTSLLDKISVQTSSLSLGQTQKLVLSGILALSPTLIILDECVSMIDPVSRSDILKFLDQWHKKGHTIIHVTHDLDEALCASRIIVFNHGKITFDGSKEEFKSKTSIFQSVFGQDISCLKQKYNIAPINATHSDLVNYSLSVENITFGYSSGKQLFSDFSLKVKKGSIVALIGETGSGKSSLLELCAGLLIPQQGCIRSNTRPSICPQEAEGAIFEQFVADDISFGPINAGKKGNELVEAVKNSMQMVALPFDVFADRQTSTLSGGEKRKVSLAGIIALNSDVLLFDEPTAALDHSSRIQVMETLLNLRNSGKTILFSTHRNDESMLADRVITLKDGKIIDDSELAISNSNESTLSLPVLQPLDGSELLEKLGKTATTLSVAKKNEESFIGKLTPLSKYLVFFVIFAFSLLARSVPICAISLCLSIIYAVLARCSILKLIRAYVKIIPWLLFFFLLQLILTQPASDDKIYFAMYFFSLSLSKILFGIKLLLRVASSLFAISAFFLSISQREIILGMKKLLYPLSLLKIPVKYIVLVTAIVFRFIPLLNEEAIMIVKTQLVRGGLKKTKGIINKIKALIPLFVPLVLQTLKRASDMAEAIVARYFFY